jgi:hypothetical protein
MVILKTFHRDEIIIALGVTTGREKDWIPGQARNDNNT